MQVGLKLRLL